MDEVRGARGVAPARGVVLDLVVRRWCSLPCRVRPGCCNVRSASRQRHGPSSPAAPWVGCLTSRSLAPHSIYGDPNHDCTASCLSFMTHSALTKLSFGSSRNARAHMRDDMPISAMSASRLHLAPGDSRSLVFHLSDRVYFDSYIHIHCRPHASASKPLGELYARFA